MATPWPRSFPCPRSWVLAALAVLVISAGFVAAESDPFEAVRLPVAGRPVLVWTGDFSANCPGASQDIVVISLAGAPPDEKRQVVLFPCTALRRRAPEAARHFAVGSEVIAVDTEPDAHELLLVGPTGLRAVDLGNPDLQREIPVPGGLPLARRARGLSRLPIAGPWGTGGGPGALLPSLGGLVLVDLRTGAQQSLELPILADYATQSPGLPDPVDRFLRAELQWPLLVPGDDDGDGRPDLFALSRWRLAVFRRGETGFPRQPSRQVGLRPFGETEELRAEQSTASYRPTDIDGDGLTDLVLHRSWGNLMRGRAATSIYLNHGDGARPDARPDALRELEDGFSSIEFLDLDGDGRQEGIETSMRFGLVQAVRMLVTRTGKATLQVLTLSADPPHTLRPGWKHDVRFKLDFANSRIEGFYPVLGADWNADGRKDLLYLDSDGSISVRLGEARPGGPGFGAATRSHSVPLRAGRTVTGDLDGDGLEDLIVYDPQAADGALWLYYNTGVLAGTPVGR